MEQAASKWREWRGNLALMVAIAVLVGVATFVVVRERLADAPPESSSQVR